MQKRLLKDKEAAAYIGVGVTKFWALVKEAHFQAIKIGSKMTRFDIQDLDRYIDSLKAQR